MRRPICGACAPRLGLALECDEDLDGGFCFVCGNVASPAFELFLTGYDAERLVAAALCVEVPADAPPPPPEPDRTPTEAVRAMREACAAKLPQLVGCYTDIVVGWLGPRGKEHFEEFTASHSAGTPGVGNERLLEATGRVASLEERALRFYDALASCGKAHDIRLWLRGTDVSELHVEALRASVLGRE